MVTQPREIVEPIGAHHAQDVVEADRADALQPVERLFGAGDLHGGPAGEPLAGGALTPWPGTEGGPHLMLGAWRNKRWIVYSAERCAGWIASGLYSQPEELEKCVQFYRDAGGKRAVLSNVIVDLQGNVADMPLGGRATVMATGSAAEALDRLKRIRAVGFDDVLCMVRPEGLDDLARLRDAL